jgi:methionine-rich copper-binding protein CopC
MRVVVALPLLLAAFTGAGCLDQPFATNVDLPLQVIQLSPTDGAVGVARDAAITATFNLPVVEASVAGNVLVESVADPAAPVAIAGAVTVLPPDGDQAPRVVFQPEALLPYSTPIRVTLSTGIERDTEPRGNLLQPAVAVFTTVDPPPLSVVSVVPGGGATGVDPATSIRITFSEPVRCASATAGITVTETFDPHPHRGALAGTTAPVAGALTCTDPPSIEDTGCANDACVVVFTPAAPMSLSSLVTVTIAGGARADGAVESFRATAVSGQLPVTVTDTFRVVDPPALLLVSSSPADGATGVLLDTAITLTFSEDVDCASLASAITVTETTDTGVVSTVDTTTGCTGATVTLTPARPFAYSADVAVTLAATIESARATSRGGQLLGGARIGFATLDPPPLVLLSSSPADGATGVARDTTITLTFSEDVACSTLTGAITLTETLDTQVAAAVDFAVACAGAVVTLTPARTLAYSADIDVVLAATIASTRATTQGGQLVGGAVIQFRTEDPPPLLVIASTPGDGSTQVPLTADVRVVFSEAVDCASVSAQSVTIVETFDTLVAARRAAASTPRTFTIACAGDTVDLVLGDHQLSSAVSVVLAGSIRSARATLSGGALADGAGVVVDFSTEDPTDLFLTNALPANGSTGIAATTTLGLTFSEAVDCATVTPATIGVTEAFAAQFLLQNPTSPPTRTHTVAVTACTGAGVTLDVPGDFQLASRITVTLPGSLASARATSRRGRLNGGAGLTYAFDIIPFPPVEVVSVSPDGGAIGSTTSFNVTFNQDMFIPEVSLTDATRTQVFLALANDVNVAPAIANAVALSCVNCQTGRAFTFAPTAALIEGSRYALVIRGGANGVRGAVGGSFMVADVVKRYLVVGGGIFVGSDPADADTGVPVTSDVCATFLVDLALTPANPVTNAADLTFLDGAFELSARTPLGTQSPVPGTYRVDGVDPVTDLPCTDLVNGAPRCSFTRNHVCITPAAKTHPCSDVDELLPDLSDITLTVAFTDNRDPEAPQTVNETVRFTTGGLPTLVDSFYEAVPEVNKTGELTTEVPVNGTLVLVFDSDVDAATVADNLRLTTVAAPGTALASTISVERTDIRIKANANLAFNTAHRIVVDGGVSGLRFADDRYLGAAQSLTFTTSPLNVVRISPINGENAIETTVTPVVFARAMFQPSLNTDTIIARDETQNILIGGAVATSTDDLFSAVFNPLPTYVQGNRVTLTVGAGALDFLGNPLPVNEVQTGVDLNGDGDALDTAATSRTWPVIGGAPAANARVPTPIAAANVAPNTGAVTATQAFVVTFPTNNAQQLENRMLPAAFNDNSVVLEQTAACAAGGAARILGTERRVTVATVALAGDVLTITSLERLRTGCNYRLTLKQKFFSNIHTIADDAAADVVVNVTGETTRPTVQSANVTNATGGQAFVVTFSEAIDLATLLDTSAGATVDPVPVVDTNNGNAVVPGTWTTSGNTAVFTPTTFWRTGRTYSVTFPTTVADLAGNTLDPASNAAARTRTLTTETTPPTPPATVTTGGGRLQLTFSEALDPASVRPTTFGGASPTLGTILVQTTNGTNVAACVDVAGAVVTIDSIDAAAGTALQIVITTGVTDQAGNAIAAPVTLTATAP